MDAQGLWGLVVLLLVIALMGQARRKRRGVRTFSVGAGAMGSVYDLLNQDKRNAIELIVEDKAAERDEEHVDDTVE